MATTQDKRDFKNFITTLMDVPSDILVDVIDFIQSNFTPEDVFEKNVLSEWAESNGYTKE